MEVNNKARWPGLRWQNSTSVTNSTNDAQEKTEEQDKTSDTG